MAIGKTFKVSLDMKAPTAQRNEWEVVEGDNGNEIEITLTDDGAPVDLTGCKVLAVFGLPTGQTVEQDTDEGSVTIGGTDHNVITIALKTGSFSPGKSSSGLMKCEIQVYSGDDLDVLVTSAQFTFRCRRAIINDETIAATDDYPILVELISEVQEIINNWQADWTEADPTDHAYIKNKPATMPPSSHTHGKIDNDGRTSEDVAHGEGDKLILADASDTGRIVRSDIALGTATNKWLNETGAWSTPAASEVGASASNHVHGHMTNGGAIPYNDTESIASGDGIVFADDSDSGKLKRSDITFDGSTDTKALTQKGTWEYSKLIAASSVTNLNNASQTVNGSIRFYTFASTSTNSPGYYGFCFFYSSNNPEGVQYAFQTSAAKISHRQRKSDGTWTSWTHIT